MTVVSTGGKGGIVTARFTGTGEVHLNTAFANNAANAVGETVNSMNIYDVWFSSQPATSTWTIARNGTNVLVLAGSGHADFHHHATVIDADLASGNCVATLSGGTGSCVIRLKKQSSFADQGRLA